MKILKRKGSDHEFDNAVIDQVCNYFEVSRFDLESRSRLRKFVEPRQLIYYLLAKYSRSSITIIGRYFYRDHTTAVHGRQHIQDLMETDIVFREEVMKLEETLKECRQIRERVSIGITSLK